MPKARRVSVIAIFTFAIFALSMAPLFANIDKPEWMSESVEKLEKQLLSKYAEGQRERATRGLDQVSQFWRAQDGDGDVFEAFVLANFAGDEAALDAMFERYELLLEKIDGHMLEIILECRRQTDLDVGPILPFDGIFAGWDPSAHVSDDFFENKLAFTVLLNFPLTTLDQRLDDGSGWTRRQWAETRLAQRFSKRIPADVLQAVSVAGGASDQYIAEYNIWMHHLLTDDGERLFRPGLRLLSHWNLRDEIKAQYSNEEAGLKRQRMIQLVMERIVEQTIPEIVIDNPHVDWNPYKNDVSPAAVSDTDTPAPALPVN